MKELGSYIWEAGTVSTKSLNKHLMGDGRLNALHSPKLDLSKMRVKTFKKWSTYSNGKETLNRWNILKEFLGGQDRETQKNVERRKKTKEANPTLYDWESEDRTEKMWATRQCADIGWVDNGVKLWWRITCHEGATDPLAATWQSDRTRPVSVHPTGEEGEKDPSTILSSSQR